MTAKSLPTKLSKEPLIDVVCAVTFAADVSASAMLPGLLLSGHTGKQPTFEALPASQLPQALRDQDPNLRNAPLMRVLLGDDRFPILIADHSLAVGCKMPYAGWKAFKDVALSVFSVLEAATFIKKIERHSLKYVDLFPDRENVPSSLSRFNLKLEVAGRVLDHEVTQLRTELKEPPFLHVATIISPAIVQRPDGTKVNGSVVDVDTHRQQEFAVVKEFTRQLPDLLEEIHTANKAFFFDLLSDSGLKELEPMYE
ncbi:MAG: TIGR04255 family protein [Alphaproteobacteria bacterium]|nr:MAG: TIGR04255 family protein [Alphaproteobacteria bacterium]